MKADKPSTSWWLGFAAILVAALALGIPMAIPGLFILLAISFFTARALAQWKTNRRFAMVPALAIFLLVSFVMVTTPGRSLLKEVTNPLVIRIWEGKLSKNPDNPVLRRHLSTYYTMAKRKEPALGHIQFLLRKDSCDAVALGNRALLFRINKEYQKSLEDCRRLVQCNGRDPVFREQLGLAYQALALSDSARQAWISALQFTIPGDSIGDRIRKRLKDSF